MDTRRLFAVSAAFLFLGAACSTGGEEATTTTTLTSDTTADAASTAATTTPTETTAAPFTRLVDLVVEPPPWEDVTLTTEDDVELFARFWPGNETALLVGHDYSVTTAGAYGQRPDQSSEAVLLFTGTFAAQGYTVLSPDYRGHGQSGGEFEPQAGVIDLKAAYSFLVDRGSQPVPFLQPVGAAAMHESVVEALRRDRLAVLPPARSRHGCQYGAPRAGDTDFLHRL